MFILTSKYGTKHSSFLNSPIIDSVFPFLFGAIGKINLFPSIQGAYRLIGSNSFVSVTQHETYCQAQP